ncbi:MAG: alanine racemase [Rickettsiales bacterium]|jgi:alanine racemase|nr:alanine racemase [Rickettsiales bacterium]
MPFSYPILNVNLSAILKNYAELKSRVKPASVAAVVKADAYGLGIAPITRALVADGCRMFFVAYAAEGIAVRAVAPTADIYVLNGFDGTDAFVRHHLIPVLGTAQQVADWRARGPYAIQVETGFHRLGLTADECHGLSPVLVMSHLMCADDKNSPQNAMQLARFLEFKKMFPDAQFSLAASGGVNLSPEYHFDIVRAGAFLYGMSGGAPVATLSADVLQIRDVSLNEFIGYDAIPLAGARNSAPTLPQGESKKIATVSLGYSDGLPRAFAEHGRVRFGKYAAPVIGRVTMDMIMVDVTGIPDWELTKAHFLTDDYGLEQMAADTNTIGYEILCSFGNALQKKYEVRRMKDEG